MGAILQEPEHRDKRFSSHAESLPSVWESLSTHYKLKHPHTGTGTQTRLKEGCIKHANTVGHIKTVRR